MRISTYALHQSTLRDATRLQFDLSQMQGQLSSGLKSRTYSGIAPQAEQYLVLESKLSKIEAYKQNNKLVESRMANTNTVLGQVIETASNLRNLISQRITTGNTPSLPFAQQLESTWQALRSQLNISVEGRFLFSGTRTDVPPIDPELAFPSLVTSGVPDDSYYQGSSEDVTARADDNIEFPYNVRANQPGFQKIMAALVIAKENDPNQTTEQLQDAMELLNGAISEVNGLQASVNANIVTLDQITERQTALSTYWKGVRDDISNTDLVGVSTQVAINEGILQASFQAFARINSLRLSDFLR
jgi:flagellar hook-associated protein 3 FlgL